VTEFVSNPTSYIEIIRGVSCRNTPVNCLMSRYKRDKIILYTGEDPEHLDHLLPANCRLDELVTKLPGGLGRQIPHLLSRSNAI